MRRRRGCGSRGGGIGDTSAAADTAAGEDAMAAVGVAAGKQQINE